jgi:aminoglycoside/choline kinase family phosphotransferase
MVALKIPASPEDVTADWLSAALHSGGAGIDATVASFDSEIIGVGVGFLGKLAKMTPRYAGTPPPGAPRTLIAKFPTLDAAAREVAMLFRFYEREVRFYEQIADRVSLRIPKPYYADIDTATGDFVLLLEDMAPACVGDQLESCSPEQALLAVHDIAAFHAGWWQQPALDELGWIPDIDDPVNLSAEDSYQQAWPVFLEHVGGALPDHLRRTGEQLGTRITQIMYGLAERPRTLIHGDYRLDNLFFASPQGGPPLAVIDWQIANRGPGAFDVAYFLSGNVTTATRRASEKGLLRTYHDTLVAGGVRDYGYDDFMRDYRMSVLFCLVYNVIGIGTLDFGNERGVALFDAWLERTGTAIADADAAALLPA